MVMGLPSGAWENRTKPRLKPRISYEHTKFSRGLSPVGAYVRRLMPDLLHECFAYVVFRRAQANETGFVGPLLSSGMLSAHNSHCTLPAYGSVLISSKFNINSQFSLKGNLPCE